MNFTDEQFEALAPFEPKFTTLTRSRYVSYVGFNNARRIDTILKDAGLQPANVRTNYASADCVKRLLDKAAKAWFEDQEARIAAANDAEAAELSAQQVLDESAAKPSLDVEVDGDIVEVTATYIAPEPAPAEEPEPEPAAAADQEPATAPSTETPAEDATAPVKAAEKAQKPKTAKK